MTPDQINEIRVNPYKDDFPLLSRNADLAFLDSAATAQRPACVLDAQRSFYETMNANALRGCIACPSRQPRPSMMRAIPLPHLSERLSLRTLYFAATPVKH